MFIKVIVLLFYIALLLIPPEVFAQKITCKEMYERCITTLENEYKECIERVCDEVFTGTTCDALDIKPASKYYECLERESKSCRQTCYNEYYFKGKDFCHESLKKCRRGDVFGSVTMDISFEGNICRRPFSDGDASFTIIGLWKFQPKESDQYVKSYRPDNLQMMGRFNKRTLMDNHDCPTLSPHEHVCPLLISYFYGGGGTILTVDPNIDIALNPLGRLVIMNFPSNLKRPKEFPSQIAPFYEVGHTGSIINIHGKERPSDDCPPNSDCLCPEYGPSTYKVRFGKFLISDDLKPDGEMSGSESWEACGNAIQATTKTKNERVADIHFSINKKSLAKKPQYDPKKKSQNEQCSTTSNSIKIRWKFNILH